MHTNTSCLKSILPISVQYMCLQIWENDISFRLPGNLQGYSPLKLIVLSLTYSEAFMAKISTIEYC